MSIRKASAGMVAMAAVTMSLIAVAPANADLAPVGRSVATALEIKPIQTLAGFAGAEAGPDRSSAEASALTVLGEDIAGVSTTGGEVAGTALEVPAGDGAVRVLPREASATRAEDGSSSAAQAYAALADAHIPGLVKLGVLTGNATAAWTPESSSSSASTDGVTLATDDGSLVIVVLHAEASGDGTGRLYVLRVNDVTVADSEATEPLSIEVPGVLDVTLLDLVTTAGSASSAQADLLQVIPLDDIDLAGILLSAQAAAGSVVEPAGQPAPVTMVAGVQVEPAAEADRLPRTGSDLLRLILLGIALTGCGAAASSARRLVGARAR